MILVAEDCSLAVTYIARAFEQREGLAARRCVFAGVREIELSRRVSGRSRTIVDRGAGFQRPLLGCPTASTREQQERRG